jgi:hypothetical protein
MRKSASSGQSSSVPSGAALPMYSKCLPPHLKQDFRETSWLSNKYCKDINT